MLFGYDTGVISGAILFIEKQLHLGEWQQGWVVSAVLLGAVIGAAIIGPSSDKYGRRKLLMVSSIIFIIGALGSSIAHNFELLVASRIVLGIGGIALPESPRYLVRKGEDDEVLAVLTQLQDNSESAQAELADIKLQASMANGGFKELFGLMARPVLVMAMGLAIFQQVMGCNTVLYYAPTIFTDVGFGVSAALIAHIGIGVFNVIVTWVAMKIMDKVDRKKMLIWGAWGMGISLFIMSFSMHFSGQSQAASYICAVALTIYIAFFSATWGPVMWVMIGESFPLNIRGLGNSFGAVVNWAANAVVSLTFPPLLNFFGTGSLFIGYAVLCIAAIVFVKYFTIETRNQSLEQIEADLRSRAHAKGWHEDEASISENIAQ